MIIKNKYISVKNYKHKKNLINQILFLKNFNKTLKLKFSKKYKNNVIFKILND